MRPEDAGMQPEQWDVVIIGGGAAGLSAGLVLARARRRVLVVDGGEPRNRFAGHMHGVLTRDGFPPLELVAAGRREVGGYGGVIADTTVVRVALADDGAFEVELADSRMLRARRVVAASGLTDELPDVPGLAERWGIDVVQCPYCDGWEHGDERIGVLATSPGNLHQAQLLRQWSDRVVFIRHDLEALEPDDERALAARGIRVVDDRVSRLLVEADRLTGVELDSGDVVELDVIFTAGRFVPRDGPLAGLDVATTDTPAGPWIAVDGTGLTSVPGLWAIGNAATPFALVPMAMGSGVQAAAAVNADLVAEEVRAAVAGADTVSPAAAAAAV